MVVPQLECFKGPMQTALFLFEIHSMIKDLLAGRLTLWRLIDYLAKQLVLVFCIL